MLGDFVRDDGFGQAGCFDYGWRMEVDYKCMFLYEYDTYSIDEREGLNYNK